MLWWLLLAAILLFLLALLLRTVVYSAKKRPLSPKILFGEEKNEWYAERMAELIRCRTVSTRDNAHAEEFQKLHRTLARLFPRLHEKAERRVFAGGCCLYRLPGKDPARSVMLLSHHDVVAAQADGWKYPPFDGVIAEGRLWGRGTIDTKGSLFAIFSAVEELLEKGWEPPVTVYIGTSHNEELLGDGMRAVAEFFKENDIRPEIALDEGGGAAELALAGKPYAFALAAVHEKGRMTLTCRAEPIRSKKAFVASPTSPVSRMASFIDAVQRDKRLFRKRVTPILRMTLDSAGPYLPFPLRILTANLWLFAPLLKRVAPLVSDEAGQLLADSCRWSAIAGGHTDSGCTAECTIRVIDQKTFEKELQQIQKHAKKYQITVSVDEANSEYRDASETTGERYAYFKRTVEEVFPSAPFVPFINPAFTDARHIREVCPCTYRFAPVLMNMQQFNSMHNKNENITLSSIGIAVEFYRRFLENYR